MSNWKSLESIIHANMHGPQNENVLRWMAFFEYTPEGDVIVVNPFTGLLRVISIGIEGYIEIGKWLQENSLRQEELNQAFLSQGLRLQYRTTIDGLKEFRIHPEDSTKIKFVQGVTPRLANSMQKTNDEGWLDFLKPKN